ncbi:protein-tyrosine kinase [Corynebacterium maris DSM 45190]|uniref:non-specific protein-tyrosine kinase n=1 Tax=Corynebacterium maris DSM 45190 TaxID=1224163 RepID=S5T3W9_9CORY|nr:polysaccharide biosynthesis tyrosine autokinase [Corynebacterium maris]AGS35345.1 protein-tyrosine kinase [Corynebacterium maris DSM 45190]
MNEWKMITRAIRSRWWVIVLVAAAVTALGATVVAQRLELYEANARVGIQVMATTDDSSGLYQGSLAAESKVASYSELISSDQLLEIASVNSGLSAEELRVNVSTERLEDTVLFDVRAIAHSPEAAVLRANAVADAYPDFVAELEIPNADSSPLAYAVVMDSARPLEAPLPPTNTQLIILSLVAGLALGLGLALLIDFLDKRIRRTEDIREIAADTPIIGEIPEGKRAGEKGLVDFQGGYSPVAEAMRNLRTQIRFLGGGPQVMMVTSAMPGEGKSFVTSNLSRSFVEAGERVLLLNADLRAPTIEKIFHVSGRTGLSNVLAGQVDLKDVVIPGKNGDPDIVPTGPTPANPSELLGLDRMKHLLLEARKQYDIVLIDVSPVVAVTDPLVLAPHVDAVIVVSRIGSSASPRLARTLQLLTNAGVSTSGIVANGVSRATALQGSFNLRYGSYGSGNLEVAPLYATRSTPTEEAAQLPAGSTAAGHVGN